VHIGAIEHGEVGVAPLDGEEEVSPAQQPGWYLYGFEQHVCREDGCLHSIKVRLSTQRSQTS
jgi:hypothetical protein